MYLDEIAEQTKKYKVTTHKDHYQDDYVRYFDDLESAQEYWRKQVFRSSGAAQFTASATLIEVATGVPILRQTWRV